MTRPLCLSMFAALFSLVALPAQAGDEVDYSAPYMTLENGELVTRYPAKAHDADAAATAGSEEPRQAPPPASRASTLMPWLVLLIAAGLAAVAWRARRGLRQTDLH